MGVGLHQFGRYPEKSFEELVAPAVSHALEDSGIPFKDVEAAFCGVVNSGIYDSRNVIQQFGWTGIPIHSVAQASSSSAAAFRLAYWSVANGEFDTALVVGYEKMGRGFIPGTLSPGASHLDIMGLDPIPARVALEMRKRMEVYSEPIEVHAAYAVQASQNAALNPNAHFQVARTPEEVLNSPMIADPLRMYMCCPTSDGAGAAVISTRAKARHYGESRAIQLAGWACGSPKLDDLVGGPGAFIGGDFKAGNLTKRLAKQLYDKAGIGPQDIKLACVHDPFTMAPIVIIEALGFCPEGEGGQWVLNGKTGITGGIPINTDGGLLCKGHPMGPTGVSQIAEIVKQLRGEAGARQVPNGPNVGLTHSSGAGMINMHLFTR
jgi:acetyl-CoA acetyltransferase